MVTRREVNIKGLVCISWLEQTGFHCNNDTKKTTRVLFSFVSTTILLAGAAKIFLNRFAPLVPDGLGEKVHMQQPPLNIQTTDATIKTAR